MSPDQWNPDQYHRFRDERSQPFRDLLEGVEARRSAPGGEAIDLGCGSGELTRELHERLRLRSTQGIDSSDAMLAKVPAAGCPGLSFRRALVEDPLETDRYGLIFSNAALQWVDGHAELIARLKDALQPEGWLAVQVPANHDHLSHRVAARIASQPPFQEALAGYRRESPVLAPEEYSLLLHRLGFEEPVVRLQIYLHLLGSRDEVVEWVKGTLLTAYQQRLSDSLYREFLERYRETLLPELPDERPFPYAFERILFWARKGKR